MDNPLYDYPVAVLLGLSAKALIRIEAMLPQGFSFVCFALANAHNWPALTKSRYHTYQAQAYASTRGSAPALRTSLESMTMPAFEPKDHAGTTRSL